jgi:hypothetical protein
VDPGRPTFRTANLQMGTLARRSCTPMRSGADADASLGCHRGPKNREGRARRGYPDGEGAFAGQRRGRWRPQRSQLGRRRLDAKRLSRSSSGKWTRTTGRKPRGEAPSRIYGNGETVRPFDGDSGRRSRNPPVRRDLEDNEVPRHIRVC